MKANKEEAIMYRRLTQIVLALVLVVAFSAVIFASNGTQIGTVGAKSTAMGSAFRGLADDWSAAYFNPAGITQFGKWEIGGSLGLIMPRGSYTAYSYPIYPSPALITDKVDATDRNFLVPAFGAFYKATEKISVGLSVFAPFGLGTEWDIFQVPAGFGNANAISKDKESYSDHQVIDIHPTVAYKLSEKLSVGLGFSYIWGKMTLDEVMLPLNPLAVPATWDQIKLVPMMLGGTAPWTWNPDQNRVIAEMNLEGKGYAYGGNLGILFKASDKFSIGLSGRYSTDLKLKGDMTQTIAYPGDPVKAQTLAAAAAALAASDPAKSAQLQAAAGAFSGATVPHVYNDIEADLPLPWTIGGGIAFKPSCCWTITADASYTNWKAWDKIELVQNGVKFNEFGLDWKNTLEIGAGVEFLALKTDCKKLFVRLGGYTVDSPVPNTTMNPTLLDPARRYMLTGGLGLAMGKVTVDLAYEHAIFAAKDIPASEYGWSAQGYALNYAGVYKFSANVITLGLGLALE
jgi:long-chain fatty acid transport protein